METAALPWSSARRLFLKGELLSLAAYLLCPVAERPGLRAGPRNLNCGRAAIVARVSIASFARPFGLAALTELGRMPGRRATGRPYPLRGSQVFCAPTASAPLALPFFRSSTGERAWAASGNIRRRGGRAVEGSGLENRQSESSRGFESHPLRHGTEPFAGLDSRARSRDSDSWVPEPRPPSRLDPHGAVRVGVGNPPVKSLCSCPAERWPSG